MLPPLPLPEPLWQVVTRLGEAQILLPVALLAALWLWQRDSGRPLVKWWLPLLVMAVCVTTATKVAFLGFGVGLPVVNFTGVSGHAMFAAAVYPLLLGSAAAALAPRTQRVVVAAAYGLALVIGLSRVALHAHSYSEVLAGLLLGGAASACAIALAHLPHTAVRWWMPMVLALWLALTPAHAPPSRTHGWVTQLSLALSGRTVPYTRAEMLDAWRARRAAAPVLSDAVR